MQARVSWAAPLPDLPLGLLAASQPLRCSMNNRPLYIGTTTTNRGDIVRFVSKIEAINGKVRRWVGVARCAGGAPVCGASAIQLLQLLLPLPPVCASSVLSHIHPDHYHPANTPTLQEVTLERPLPFGVRPEFAPRLLPRTSKVYESGVEGLTIAFKWDVYKGGPQQLHCLPCHTAVYQPAVRWPA